MSIFMGSGVALVTPFDNNDNVDYHMLDKLLDLHLNNKTDALIINGTTGESPTLSEEEKCDIIKYVVKKVKGKIPIIAGSGTNNTKHAVMSSINSERCGADALLVVTPYYNKGNESGLYDYYKCISDAVNIPVIVYVVPSRTGVNISVPLLKKIAALKNIVAIKDATGNLSYTAEIAAQIPELDIYSGNDDVVLPLLSLGGKGVISVSANIIPTQTHDMVMAFLDRDFEKSKKLQLDNLDIIKALFIETNPAPVKEAMNMLGYNVGACRSPMGPLSDKNRQILSNILKDHGVKI